MRINQNLLATNANRNLTSTNSMMSKNLEKLASGLRINRSADDAAGLVVSQNLRAQVTGLRQASRNAQDGISVVQTAEGALNEVHTMLNRMRDLAVQAANTGGNDMPARVAAQAEITQLSTELNRLASATKFGTTSLLSGTYGLTAASRTGALAANSVSLVAGNTFTININGLGAVTVAFTAQTAVTGAQAAGVPAAPWRRFGELLGEAYQVADDIRDVAADPALIGKPVGRDVALARPSSARELGLEGAVRYFEQLVRQVVAAIPECRGADALRALVADEADRLVPSEIMALAA